MRIKALTPEQRPNGSWKAVGYDMDAKDARDTSYYGVGDTKEEAVAELKAGLERNKHGR